MSSSKKVESTKDVPMEKSTLTLEMLNTEQVMLGFGCTRMTVYLRRQKQGLPFIEIPSAGKPAIRFDEADIKGWAKEKGIKFDSKKAKIKAKA